MKELPDLWITIGGTVGARFGQDTLSERIAARIQGRGASGRILNPALSFFLVGIEPIKIRMPRRTMLINAIETLGLPTAMR